MRSTKNDQAVDSNFKFSNSLFLLKIQKNLMSIGKQYCSEFQKLSSQKLLFKVSLFRFYFVSAFWYLNCDYNQYPVKQAPSLRLKLPLKPAFFQCVFQKGKPLLKINLFTTECLNQIPPFQKMKEAFSEQPIQKTFVFAYDKNKTKSRVPK